ncbi:peptidoglycan DD-metalloendopeptidase family protein [Limibacter armeniacum]|uniref:murein hydrolase activator EnvC family protein n=1 Tax=Limibacter armeniacum TaxID=466084 RepID=UPI002FE68F23
MKRILLLILGGLLCLCTYGQERDQLEKQRSRTLQRIEAAGVALQEAQTETLTGMAKLKDIEGHIREREKLIGQLKEEQRYLEVDIHQAETQINEMELELHKLKEEYGEMIYIAYKTSSSYQKLGYLFASGTLEQLVSRINYLEHYKQARKEQIEEIKLKMDDLLAKKEELAQKEKAKEAVLAEQENQLGELEDLRTSESKLLAELRQKVVQVKADLEDNNKALRRLDGAITRAIQRQEAEVAAEKEALANMDFSAFKGKLEWPTKGFVSGKFGRHPHPVIEGESVENHGVVIRTTKGATVQAVQAGEVFAVTRVPDLNYVVMILHGDYLTVYANLEEVSVKVWQVVKPGEHLGEVAKSLEGSHELQFQIWRGDEKLNPESWLKQ